MAERDRVVLNVVERLQRDSQAPQEMLPFDVPPLRVEPDPLWRRCVHLHEHGGVIMPAADIIKKSEDVGRAYGIPPSSVTWVASLCNPEQLTEECYA